MPRYLWLIVVPFFLGCAKDHDAPVAELEYIELSREKNTSLYEVRFLSSIDFFNIFEKGKRPISSILRCSLGYDEVSIDHDADQYLASGLVSVAQPVQDGEVWAYSSILSFYESLNDGRSRRTLHAGEFQRLLQDKQFVPCVYTATAFGFKPYRSATMRVPVADIFREVGIR